MFDKEGRTENKRDKELGLAVLKMLPELRYEKREGETASHNDCMKKKRGAMFLKQTLVCVWFI